MTLIKTEHNTPQSTAFDAAVRNILLTRRERLSCVVLFSTFSILFLQSFHLFFLWRYAAAGIENSPHSNIVFYIFGIVLIVAFYGIIAAIRGASPWLIFGISVLILLVPLIAIGAEAYHYYEFISSTTANL